MTKPELDELAYSIAYEASVSLIEGCGRNVTREANGLPEDAEIDELGTWWELPTEQDETLFCVDTLKDAVLYLETRGLLTRHSTNANWVSIADESEPVMVLLDLPDAPVATNVE
jgi:hypothetical protein